MDSVATIFSHDCTSSKTSLFFNFISFLTSLPLQRLLLTENSMFDPHINGCLTTIKMKLVKKFMAG